MWNPHRVPALTAGEIALHDAGIVLPPAFHERLDVGNDAVLRFLAETADVGRDAGHIDHVRS